VDINYNVKLPVDEYEVKVVHPNLGKWQKMIAIKENEDTELVINFLRQVAVKINAMDKQKNPIKANIFVDGKDTGKLTPNEIKVRIGRHKFRVQNENYQLGDIDKEVFVDEGFVEPLIFILENLE
jgi:hypothetical protein